MDQPTKLSLVYPFYQQHETFRHHLNVWSKYPKDLKERIEIIVVDDCSEPPLELPHCEVPLSLYRVKTPIYWNYGAKNLGILRARFDWVLLSELDHLVDEGNLRLLLDLPREARTVYQFRRVNHSPGAHPRYNDRVHLASLLFRREFFWEVGGIDEDFSGAYGHDDTFLKKCFEGAGGTYRVAPGVVLRNFSGNHELPDADLWNLADVPRDTTRNEKLLRRKLRPWVGRSRRILRFDWERVLPP